MIAFVVQGIGYGFAGASQPGPFQTYVISQTLKNGWQRSLSIALAPLISDGPIILLVLFALSRVPSSMQRALHVASGIFLIYLAWGAFINWRRAAGRAGESIEPGHQSMLKAVFMNLINPGPYVYWSLVAGPAFLAGWRDAPASGIGFLLGFYGTLVATFAAIIMVFGTAREFGPKLTRLLLGISALALAGFGIYQMWLGLLGA